MKYYRECGAKRRNGEPCKAAAMPNGRCRLHGGKMPSGLATAATRHGRYSKHLPTRMAARYAEAQVDTELLALRDEIALLDSRLSDVLSRVDTGESGWLWQTLKDAAGDLKSARWQNDQAGMADALNNLLRLVDAGHQDYAAWSDVRSLLEQRRRTVESERKRLVEMQQMVTTDRLMLLVGALAGVVRDSILANVKDKDQARRALASASTGIERLISVGSSVSSARGAVESE
jgi:hypothetical protein